jgi:hypothetical protein
LQLLPIVVGGDLLDLRLDLSNARLDVGFLACTVDDCRVLLVDHHLLGAAEHGDCDVFELSLAASVLRLAELRSLSRISRAASFSDVLDGEA